MGLLVGVVSEVGQKWGFAGMTFELWPFDPSTALRAGSAQGDKVTQRFAEGGFPLSRE